MNKKTMKNVALPFLLILMGFGVISLSIALFWEISENVLNQQINVFNNFVIDFFQYTFSPQFDDVMIFITELGSVWFIAVVGLFIALVLWFKKRDKWGILFLTLSVGGGGLIIMALKRYYQIERPSINEQIDAIGYSFPSGHAMGSLILYGFIVYLIIRSKLSKAKKISYSAVLISLIILIAISRVYLNAHFPSDVIAGQAGGLAWLLACIISLEVVKIKRRNDFQPLKLIGNLIERYNQLK